MLAKKSGSNIILIHVIGKNENNDEETIEKENGKAKLRFEEIVKKFEPKIPSKSTLSYTVKKGKIFEEVTKLAEETEDSLLMMSTHGESGFEDLFIGGNAYKIAAHSKNPVITSRSSEIPKTFHKIVLPLDITFQTREKVPFTIGIAKLFNSEIHLVSVRQTDDKSIENKLHQYIDQVASYLGKQNIAFKIEHLHGDNITDMTLDYSISVKADLISIMTEQEKSISNLLLGSYAHQMINKSLIPVLAFPNYRLRIIAEDVWTLGAFNGRTA